MNRKLLSDAAPRWIAIQTLPAQAKFNLIAMFMDAILDAIEIDHGEPDTWEAMYAAYTIHALVEGRYYAALGSATFVATIGSRRSTRWTLSVRPRSKSRDGDLPIATRGEPLLIRARSSLNQSTRRSIAARTPDPAHTVK